MRTVPFRTVYEGIVRRMGYNPRAPGEPKEDVARNVLQHVNDRAQYAWTLWDWPELNAVEWRALRPVWTNLLVPAAGTDVYYFGDGVTPPTSQVVDPPQPGTNAGYYRCIVQPPAGTLPTNATYYTSYFNLTFPLDRYIAYSQTGLNVIGDLLDVYDENPREFTRTTILRSAPSSKGIDLPVGDSNDVVWIKYRIPFQLYTIDPFIPGLTQTGQTYYDEVTGNCFISTAATFGPNNATDTPVPFPSFLSQYVKAAAYGDAVLETAMEAAVRQRVSQDAETEALEYLQHEVDRLAVQGQRIFYSAFPSRRRDFRRNIPDVGLGAIPFEVFKGTT